MPLLLWASWLLYNKHFPKQTGDKAKSLITIPPIPERERIGRMLKGARYRANMTQKQLAKAIGVPQGHISEYEAHKRPIPKAKAALLAKVLRTVETHFIPRYGRIGTFK